MRTDPDGMQSLTAEPKHALSQSLLLAQTGKIRMISENRVADHKEVPLVFVHQQLQSMTGMVSEHNQLWSQPESGCTDTHLIWYLPVRRTMVRLSVYLASASRLSSL